MCHRLQHSAMVGNTVASTFKFRNHDFHQLQNLLQSSREWPELPQKLGEVLHRAGHPTTQSSADHVCCVPIRQFSLVSVGQFGLRRRRTPWGILHRDLADTLCHHCQPHHLRGQVPPTTAQFPEADQPGVVCEDLQEPAGVAGSGAEGQPTSVLLGHEGAHRLPLQHRQKPQTQRNPNGHHSCVRSPIMAVDIPQTYLKQYTSTLRFA